MYLLFDVGVSRMRVAVSPDGRNFSEPVIRPTPPTSQEVIESLAAASRQLAAGPPRALVGGVTRRRRLAPDELSKHFACPVFLENDAALVGLGEAVAGAGQTRGLMVYLTISTGVGGARIVDGRIDQSAWGFEPGHQIINFHEPERVLEDYISGQAVTQQTGQSPGSIKDPDFWENLSTLAAYGVYNTILHWSPELVVIGGGMMKQPGIILASLKRQLEKIMKVFPSVPPLVAAQLGDLGGLHGALALLAQKSVG